MTKPDYSTVTETPGVGATAEQLSMLYTRYQLASKYCHDKDVLEVACGSGMGLGYLARSANKVVGVDIEESNLRFAEETYTDNETVEVRHADAEQLPFDDNSFDTVLFYEAIYYLENAPQFVAEALRVLRPDGVLLVCSVNCEWSDFNKSPFSNKYYSGSELTSLLADHGFKVKLFGGYLHQPSSASRRVVSSIRQWAARWRLIPRTMRGKELLKRLFYGRLKPMDRELREGTGRLEELVNLSEGGDARNYKVLYAVARSTKSTNIERKVA